MRVTVWAAGGASVEGVDVSLGGNAGDGAFGDAGKELFSGRSRALGEVSVDTSVSSTVQTMRRSVQKLTEVRVPDLEIDATGTTGWKVDGVLHREDGPAIEYARGMKEWRLGGQLHRDDGPAVEWEDGSKEWHRHGRLHREDGPAVEYSYGAREWWLNGQQYIQPQWLRDVLTDRPLTTHQRELLFALSENWAGTPELLYETVTNLAG